MLYLGRWQTGQKTRNQAHVNRHKKLRIGQQDNQIVHHINRNKQYWQLSSLERHIHVLSAPHKWRFWWWFASRYHWGIVSNLMIVCHAVNLAKLLAFLNHSWFSAYSSLEFHKFMLSLIKDKIGVASW